MGPVGALEKIRIRRSAPHKGRRDEHDDPAAHHERELLEVDAAQLQETVHLHAEHVAFERGRKARGLNRPFKFRSITPNFPNAYLAA